MSIKIGVGFSESEDIATAISQTWKQVTDSLSGSWPNVVLVFATIKEYPQSQLISQLKKNVPDSHLIGCSVSSLITPDGIKKKGLLLIAINGVGIEFKAGIGQRLQNDPEDAGKKAGTMVLEQSIKKVPTFNFMVMDGVAGQAETACEAIRRVFHYQGQMIAFSSGDPELFQQTYQYLDKQVITDSMVALGILGNFQPATSTAYGWEPLLPGYTVTQSSLNEIQTLNDQPASDVMESIFKDASLQSNRQTFGKWALTYPMAWQEPGSEQFHDFFITELSSQKSLKISSSVPTNSKVYFLTSNHDLLIESMQSAIEELKKNLNGVNPNIVLMLNSQFRNNILMNHNIKEVDLISKNFPNIPVYGAYGYGIVTSVETPNGTFARYMAGGCQLLALKAMD